MKRLFLLVAAVAAFGIIVHGSAFAADHAAVGAEKCGKMCHKVEFESWAKTKHATGKEKVDCEMCHGNGADYMKLSIMKDPAKAKSLGLIAKPEKAGCTAKCHKAAEFKDDMMTKTHDHKVKK